MNHKFFRITEQAEPWFYYIFTLVNALPLLIFKYFPTVDGPAHLYNANLILELLKNPDSPIAQYFSINPNLFSNCIGHLYILFFRLYLPARLAEKVLLLTYLLGLPVCFRYFITNFKHGSRFMLYMVFPFTYSFLFYFGFHNFQLGLVLLFLSLGYLLRKRKHLSISNSVIFMILSTLLVLTHAFVFIIYLIALFFLFISDLVKLYNEHSRTEMNIIMKSLYHQLLALVPAIILLTLFFLSLPPDPAEYIRYPAGKLLLWVRQIQPAKGIMYGREDIYTTWLFFLLSFLFIIEILRRFILFKKWEIIFKRISDVKVNKQDIWLLITLVLFCLYLIVPDGKEGLFTFASSRFLLFFYLFLITWLSFQEYHLWIRIPSFLVILVMNIYLLGIYYDSTKKLSPIAEDITGLSVRIDKYAVILPVNNSGYWLFGHFSNYLGIEKPMVILENYEAELPYFPVKWNDGQLPDLRPGISVPDSCITWKRNPENPMQDINYILVLKGFQDENDNCNNILFSIITKNYVLIDSTESLPARLYRLRE